MTDQSDSKPSPPYGSFGTFWGFSESLAEHPLPPRIDRTMLSSKSGTDQAHILSSLKFLGLIDGENNVQSSMETLTSKVAADRKRELQAVLRANYPNQLEVSAASGTEGQLLESIERDFGLTGDTRRKAMTFFLHAAREAGLPLSPHFPVTRSGSGRGPAKRRRPTPRKAKPEVAADAADRGDSPGAGDCYSVKLESGGKISVVVDVDLFAMSTEDRNFVIELVDKLKGYEIEDYQDDDQ